MRRQARLLRIEARRASNATEAENQPANPSASCWFASLLTPLSIACLSAERSAAISAHAPKPSDSSRFSKWPRPRRSTALLRASVADVTCHVDQARESSRFVICFRAVNSCSDRAAQSRACSTDDSHPAKPSATFRLIMKLVPFLSLQTTSAHKTAISTHARQPRDTSWLSMWPRLVRIESRFALSATGEVTLELTPSLSCSFITWSACSSQLGGASIWPLSSLLSSLLLPLSPERALTVPTTSAFHAVYHVVKPRASLRLTILLSTLSDSRMNSARPKLSRKRYSA